MDPVTIGIILAAAVFFVICYFVFNIASQGSSFEESYGKDRLKLLADDKNVKNKQKNGKVKKIAKVEKKTSYEKPETKTVESVKVEVKSVVEPIPEPEKPKVEPTPQAIKTVEAPVKSTVVEARQSAVPKKNKKKAPKADSLDSNSESKESQKVVDNVTNKNANEPVARTKREASNQGNVDFEKLIERLSTSEDFGPEYLSFVCQFAEKAKQKESNLNELVSKLQREISTKNRELESLHDQVYDAQTNVGKVQSLEQALKEEKERHNAYVSTIKPKLAENYQLREAIRKLEEQSATQNQAGVNAMDKLKRESEQIVTQLRNSLAQANNQLHQKDLFIKDLEQEHAKRSHANKERDIESDTKEKLIKELNDIINKKDSLVGKLEKELELKSESTQKLIDDFKRREQQLTHEKDEQIKEANAKLENELKESLERINVLRSRNYKLVESINAFYNSKNSNNSDENKIPQDLNVNQPVA